MNGSNDSSQESNRSIMGILVHPLSLLTGGIVALVMYVLAQNEYTKANARNAVNWYISILGLFVVTFVTFFLGADEIEAGGTTIEFGILPESLSVILGLIGIALMIVLVLAYLATLIFALIATVKAISGTAWKYPFSRSFVGR
ncbi:DUF4870 domain-containing protein [Halostagnicola bangensis]